jgi:hypothetical protein
VKVKVKVKVQLKVKVKVKVKWPRATERGDHQTLYILQLKLAIVPVLVLACSCT